MGFYCNLITNYELIFTWAQGVKYAGFALFFVVVGFLSLKTYYFKFDKTTEPWGTFFSWRHFGMDHQCISLAFNPRHIWIYWIHAEHSLLDWYNHSVFFCYLHWDLWNTHCNPAEQKLNRMTSITLLPTYFCVTVKSEGPFSGFRYSCIPKELWGIQELKYVEGRKIYHLSTLKDCLLKYFEKKCLNLTLHENDKKALCLGI